MSPVDEELFNGLEDDRESPDRYLIGPGIFFARTQGFMKILEEDK